MTILYIWRCSKKIWGTLELICLIYIYTCILIQCTQIQCLLDLHYNGGSKASNRKCEAHILTAQYTSTTVNLHVDKKVYLLVLIHIPSRRQDILTMFQATGAFSIMGYRYEIPLWDTDMRSHYGIPIWDPIMGYQCENPIMGYRYETSHYGIPIWDPIMGYRYEIPLWDTDMRSHYGILIWDPIMGYRYEIPLCKGQKRNWIVSLA